MSFITIKYLKIPKFNQNISSIIIGKNIKIFNNISNKKFIYINKFTMSGKRRIC